MLFGAAIPLAFSPIWLAKVFESCCCAAVLSVAATSGNDSHAG